MPTLTEAAGVSRIAIKWGFVGLISLMVGRMIVGSLIAWYRATHPIIPPPTIGFGILPLVEFPAKTQPQLTYKLETVDGALPDLGTQADVLYSPPTRPNLLAMERSTQEAANLGYKSVPEKLSDISYRWKNSTPLPSALTMQIYEGKFVLEADWSSNPNFMTERFLPGREQAIKDAKTIINKLGKDLSDLADESAEMKFLKGTLTGYQPVPSLSDADFIQVDLYRKPHKDEYAFMTPDPQQGVVRIILSGNSKLAKVVRVDYNYFPIDYTRTETYPLKTTDEAWLELQQGKGYIASLDKGITDVTVRNVKLAYFDSFSMQHYIQPIYVFTGDRNFIGYVPAVPEPTNQ